MKKLNPKNKMVKEHLGKNLKMSDGKTLQDGFDSAVRQLQLMPFSFNLVLKHNLVVNEEAIKAHGVYQLFASVCPFNYFT